MSVPAIREEAPQNLAIEEETPPLPPTDLPYDDGEPESNRHRIAMNVLIESLHQAYRGRDDYYASGNMFVYYSSRQARNRDFRGLVLSEAAGPDFFVVLDKVSLNAKAIALLFNIVATNAPNREDANYTKPYKHPKVLGE